MNQRFTNPRFMNPRFMNPCFINLTRIEFLVTLACTGRCKHCSQGVHSARGKHLDGEIAAQAVRAIAAHYPIRSLMTFGGEPLLYPDETCAIHAAARDAGIPERQLITNGFFSRDEKTIRRVAEQLVASGVNNLLLSVDAFHQETIPLDPVLLFARSLRTLGIESLRVHPAWLVGERNDNPYNRKTHELLKLFGDEGINASSGNTVFPSGSALTYFSDYFDLTVPPENPYEQDPHDLRAVCIAPDGSLLGGNITETAILDILENYKTEEKQA